MITGVYGSSISSYLTLEEKRIHTAVDASKVRYLFKFTNDSTKKVKYAYGFKSTHNDRYVFNHFVHNTTEDVFQSRIDFKPFGFWYYEVYEVTWLGTVTLTAGTPAHGETPAVSATAPSTEKEILEENASRGVVQGKVEEGKLYIQETVGSEQIQYTQHTTTETNYLYAD
tara:strand:+ start:331 stop:840 length:510 start_codon:yes stop_codon:yes gene_type:complete